MGHRVSARKRILWGVTVIAFAFSAFVGAATASAATQHWAGTKQPAAPFVPYGTQQQISGQLNGFAVLKWGPSGSAKEISCTTTPSSAGTAENPAGGAAGVFHSEALILGGCQLVGRPECEIAGGSLSLSPLSVAAVESGENVIKTSGAQTSFTIQSQKNAVCPFPIARTYKMEGQLSARENAGNTGNFTINEYASISKLRVDGAIATLSAGLILKTPAGQPLVESSTTTPGVPHWYIGDSEWSTFKLGQTVGYKTSGAASMTMKSSIGGGSVEFVCGGTGTGLSGSLENPSGGGAGSTKAQVTLVNCTINVVGCVLPNSIVSKPLAGSATEVGGVPTVDFAPSEGTGLFGFSILQDAGSAKECPVKGSYTISGKLRAASVGDGNFELSGNEEKLGVAKLSTSGHLALETEAGEAVRLQP